MAFSAPPLANAGHKSASAPPGVVPLEGAVVVVPLDGVVVVDPLEGAGVVLFVGRVVVVPLDGASVVLLLACGVIVVPLVGAAVVLLRGADVMAWGATPSKKRRPAASDSRNTAGLIIENEYDCGEATAVVPIQ